MRRRQKRKRKSSGGGGRRERSSLSLFCARSAEQVVNLGQGSAARACLFSAVQVQERREEIERDRVPKTGNRESRPLQTAARAAHGSREEKERAISKKARVDLPSHLLPEQDVCVPATSELLSRFPGALEPPLQRKARERRPQRERAARGAPVRRSPIAAAEAFSHRRKS